MPSSQRKKRKSDQTVAKRINTGPPKSAFGAVEAAQSRPTIVAAGKREIARRIGELAAAARVTGIRAVELIQWPRTRAARTLRE